MRHSEYIVFEPLASSPILQRLWCPASVSQGPRQVIGSARRDVPEHGDRYRMSRRM